MNKTEERIDKLKQRVSAIRQARESAHPYGAELKYSILDYAVRELADIGTLHELGDKVGLDDSQLIYWFRELIARMAPEELGGPGRSSMGSDCAR